MAFERLTTANNPKISKIRAEFFVKENNFLEKYLKNKFVLVAGSGLGHDSFRIAEYAKKVIGVDILQKLVDHSIKNNKQKNLSFELGDFKNLKYEDDYFDATVLNMGTIGNFDDKEIVIRELMRVSKKLYIDFYINSDYALKKRKKMYEEELWRNVKVNGKKIVSGDGLESNPVYKEELDGIANNLGVKVDFYEFCDIAIMAVFIKQPI